MAADVQRLAFAADEFFGVNERWPSHAELLELDTALARRDIWGQEFVFERTAEGEYQVRSPGMDGQLGTDDDIVSWPMRGGQVYAERQRVPSPRAR